MTDRRRTKWADRPLAERVLNRSKRRIRRLGRVGLKRKAGMDEASRRYPLRGPCQFCGLNKFPICHHHKTRRSEGGTEHPLNLIALCWSRPGDCHERVHAPTPEGKRLLKLVRDSTANIVNREILEIV